MLTLGAVHTGAGGLALGLERAGFARLAWFLEDAPRKAEIVAQHWPSATPLVGPLDAPAADVVAVDLSAVNPRGEVDGDGLLIGWGAAWAVLRLARPRVAIVATGAGGAFLERGGRGILADLAAGGFDGGWAALPAPLAGLDGLQLTRILFVAVAQGARREIRSTDDGAGGDGGPARSGVVGSADGLPDQGSRVPLAGVGGGATGLPVRMDVATRPVRRGGGAPGRPGSQGAEPARLTWPASKSDLARLGALYGVTPPAYGVAAAEMARAMLAAPAASRDEFGRGCTLALEGG